MHERDLVVLTHPIVAHGLEAGDIGTIVHVYQDGAAYEVEFVTAEGATVAVLTLTSTEVRPRASREILHVRELASAD
jgi:hypothetical protein